MPATYATLTARDRTWSLDDFVDEVNALLPQVVPADAAARGKPEVNARLVRHYATEGVLPKPLKEGVEARYDGDHLVRVLALRRLLADGYPSSLAGAFLRRHDREALARFLLGEFRLDLDLVPGGVPVGGGAALPDAGAQPNAAALGRLAAMRARAGLPPLAPTDSAPAFAHREEAAAHLEDVYGAPPAPPLGALLSEPAGAPFEEAAAAPLHAAPPAAAAKRSVRLTAAPLTFAAEAGFLRTEAPPEPTPAADRGVAWTHYPLIPGLEIHVRGDFVDPNTPAAWRALHDAVVARLEAIALERSTRR